MDYSMDDKITITRRERQMNSDAGLLQVIEAKLALAEKSTVISYERYAGYDVFTQSKQDLGGKRG